MLKVTLPFSLCGKFHCSPLSGGSATFQLQKAKKKRNPEVCHSGADGIWSVHPEHLWAQTTGPFMCNMKMCTFIRSVWHVCLRLAAWQTAGGRSDGDGAVRFILSAESLLMRYDPRAAPGVRDGSLVCRLPRRHPAEGKYMLLCFCFGKH